MMNAISTPPLSLHKILLIFVAILLPMLSFSQRSSSSTPFSDEVYGMPWEVSLSHSETNHLKTCCDTLTITFEFHLKNYDEPNPAFAQLVYFEPDQELILDNCNRIPINGGVDHMIQVDTTFPSVEDLIQETGDSSIVSVFATVVVPNTYYNTTVEPAEFSPTWKDTTGSIRGMSNIFFEAEGPKSCFTSDTVSNLINEGEILNNQKLSIGLDDYAELVVDEYFKIGDHNDFRGSSFVGKASSIKVLSGDTLVIHKNEFIACRGYFWKGIYLEEGATLIMEDVILTAAEHGIKFEKGAILALEDNIFENNFIHIKGKGVTIPLGGGSTGSNTQINSFENNIFRGNDNGTYTGQGVFPKKYSGQPTNPQDYPFAGIVLGNNQSTLQTCGTVSFMTNDTGEVNTFSKMANGIVNNKNGATIKVKGSVFNDIVSSYGSGYSTKGFGIKHDASFQSCIINGFVTWPDGYSYRNVETALRTNYALLVKFDHQRVDSSDRGVHSTKTIHSSYVNNNVISTDYNGIEINNLYHYGEFEIQNNIIKVVSANYPEQVVDIALSNVHCQSGNLRGSIEENQLYVDEGYASLGTKNIHNIDIKNNYCAGTANQINYKGMIFDGGSNMVINCNGIVSEYDGQQSTTESRAIEIAGLSNSLLQCNTINDTEVGLQVFGNCDGTEIKGNEFDDHEAYGVRYGYSEVDSADYAQTGKQVYNGNLWLSSYSQAGAYGALHFDDDNYRLSKYIVNDNPSSDFTTLDLPSDFVDELNEESNYECDVDSCATQLNEITGSWDGLDSVALVDSGIKHTYQVSLLWDLQWHTFRRMKEGWLPSNSNFQQLVQQKGIADIYTAEREFANRVRLSNCPYISSIDITAMSVDTISHQQWDSMYTESSSVYDSLQNALGEWTIPLPDTGSYHALHHMSFEKQKALWESDSGYISSFSIPECTLKGGDAWYKLNSLQPPSAASYQLDTVNCNEAVLREYESVEKPRDLRIYPNPATDYIYVGKTISENYQVIDMNGRVMQEGKLPDSGKLQLHNKLPTGFYFLRNGNNISRFVIMK